MGHCGTETRQYRTVSWHKRTHKEKHRKRWSMCFQRRGMDIHRAHAIREKYDLTKVITGGGVGHILRVRRTVHEWDRWISPREVKGEREVGKGRGSLDIGRYCEGEVPRSWESSEHSKGETKVFIWSDGLPHVGITFVKWRAREFFFQRYMKSNEQRKPGGGLYNCGSKGELLQEVRQLQRGQTVWIEWYLWECPNFWYLKHCLGRGNIEL